MGLALRALTDVLLSLVSKIVYNISSIFNLGLALRALTAVLLSYGSILKLLMVILMHTTATDALILLTYHFELVTLATLRARSVINHIIIPLRIRFAFLQFSPGGSDSFLYVLVCMRRIRSYPRICLLTGGYGDNVARVLWRPPREAKTQTDCSYTS